MVCVLSHIAVWDPGERFLFSHPKVLPLLRESAQEHGGNTFP